MTSDMQWLDAAGVGQMISKTAQEVRERVSALPDFPRPSRIPSRAGVRQGRPRWLASEIHAWMLKKRDETGGRPRDQSSMSASSSTSGA